MARGEGAPEPFLHQQQDAVHVRPYRGERRKFRPILPEEGREGHRDRYERYFLSILQRRDSNHGLRFES